MTTKVVAEPELYCRRILDARHHIASDCRHKKGNATGEGQVRRLRSKITKARKAVHWWGKRYDEGCERLGLVRWNLACCADRRSANAGCCPNQGSAGRIQRQTPHRFDDRSVRGVRPAGGFSYALSAHRDCLFKG